jgi:glycosyltransferase involved in cell wall biosynthesis
MPDTHILFLTLRVFSATGGIEKMCRVAGKAMFELYAGAGNQPLKIFSLYDKQEKVNANYFPAAIFTGFGKNRFSFLRRASKQGLSSRIVVLSHVNLLVVGYCIKKLSPNTKLVLMAHGIEVWRVFPWWKKKMLQQCDLLLPVSEFTKNKMQQLYGLPEEKMKVLNNCLDPFLTPFVPAPKSQQLLNRYGLNTSDLVLFTLTRLAGTEQYKGYDMVMQTVHDLKDRYPGIKYLLAGKWDREEKQRMDELVDQLGLQKQVVFTGFIPDQELALHYALADLYIMPSRKEGFGIVFIEAMFYGKPVIAGNADGSVDALKSGRFGLLVNPASQQEITAAIVSVLDDPKKFTPQPEAVLEHFGFDVYKEKLRGILGQWSMVNCELSIGANH